MSEWLLAAVVVVGAVYAIVVYNRLVRDRQFTRSGWSDIGVQLKRRHDLIPQLVEAVRRYAAWEQATLARVSELRVQAQNVAAAAQQGPLEGDISRQIGSIFALQEAYPELRADSNFLQLQTEISTVETDIQFARRYYNGAVRNLNTRIDSFPDLLLARLFAFRAAEYFEFEESGSG